MMENKIKQNTQKTISELHISNIRTILVTGDNILTSISVARQINMITPEKRIYYGDISEETLSGKYRNRNIIGNSQNFLRYCMERL